MLRRGRGVTASGAGGAGQDQGLPLPYAQARGLFHQHNAVRVHHRREKVICTISSSARFITTLEI